MNDITLTEALATGAVIDVEGLLFEGQFEVWHALGQLLPQRGWKPMVVWSNDRSDRYQPADYDLCWVPSNATLEQVRATVVPRIEPSWIQNRSDGIIWSPAEVPDSDDQPAEYFNADYDDGYVTKFPDLAGFIAWLDAAIGATAQI